MDQHYIYIIAETVKLFEEGIGMNLHDVVFGNKFLDLTPKA